MFHKKPTLRAIVWSGVMMGAALNGWAKEKPPPHWGPRFATPGVQLKLEEEGREKRGASTSVSYTLVFSGFPQDKTYALWNDPSGVDPPVLWATGISVTSSGDVICAGPPPGTKLTPRSLKKAKKQRQCYAVFEEGFSFRDRFVTSVDHYHEGEPVEFGMISADHTVHAFAKTMPFPLEVKEGRCRLWAEMITTEAFSFSGEGFEPGEELTYISRSCDEVLRGKIRVSRDGRFGLGADPPHLYIIAPACSGPDADRSRLAIAA